MDSVAPATHTPGPWQDRGPNHVGSHLVETGESGSGLLVAQVFRRPSDVEGERVAADARLIAATTEMFDLLSLQLARLTDGRRGLSENQVEEWTAEIRAVLAKASGGES